MWVGSATRSNSDHVRLLLATRSHSWRCLGQAEQALSFAIAALQGKRKWSKAIYLNNGTNNNNNNNNNNSNKASSVLLWLTSLGHFGKSLVDEIMAFFREPEELKGEELLQDGLWSELSDEVMELVLAWLPLPSLFRMRCVCQKWYNIFKSQGFLDAYARVPAQPASFLHLIRVNGELLAAFHDPTVCHWQRVSLDSIPVNAYIHGGGGGLVCCQRVENGSLVLSVCNPLTKAWRDLPSMPRRHASTCFVKMVADTKANSYRVIRVGQLQQQQQPLPHARALYNIELFTEVFDSVTGCWTSIDNTPMDLRFIQGCSASAGFLHCRTSTTRRMMAFNLTTGLWTEVLTSNLDAVLDAKMVDCDGQPYLVSRVWRAGRMDSINIWGRKRTSPQPTTTNRTEEWEEVARMPSSLFQEWSSSAGLFYHVGVGDFIYSTCLAGGSSKLATYSLQRRKWRLVDGCPVSQSNTYLGGFEFRPRLDAAV